MKTHEEELEDQFEKESALNRLLLDTEKNQAALLKHYTKMLLIVLITFAATVCVMVGCFFWYESQYETQDKTTEKTVTTTDLDTTGENSDINYVNDGDMYNDDATHTN